MRLFPLEIEIDPDEGFDPKKDIFGRKEFGDRLTQLVNELEGPAVLLLDAPWGSGKSTFVKMWRGAMAQQGIQSLYFDAFANDYHHDGFLALAGEVVARAEALRSAPKKATKTFVKAAVGVGKVLGRAALYAGVKAATAGIVDTAGLEAGISAIAETSTKIGEDAAKRIDALLTERIENHKKDREAFSQFRKALTDLSRALSPPNDPAEPDKEPNPLVFIIDELDRCRPTFALEILEKIKHFFSVEGVIFVLVSSLEQLEKSVRFAYGNVDARTYLEKFYQLRILFPSGRPDRPNLGAATYLRYLFQRVVTAGTAGVLGDQLIDAIASFDRIHPLSFRTLERVGAYVALLNTSITQRHFVQPYLIAGLCILKVIQPALYDRARTGQLTFEEVDNVLAFSQWRTEHDASTRSQLSQRAEVWWRYALGAPLKDEEKHQIDSGMWQYNFGYPGRTVTYLCEVLDGFVLGS